MDGFFLSLAMICEGKEGDVCPNTHQSRPLGTLFRCGAFWLTGRLICGKMDV